MAGGKEYDKAFKNILFNLIYISEKNFNNESDIPFLLKWFCNIIVYKYISSVNK